MRRSFVIVLFYATMTAAVSLIRAAGIPRAMGVAPPSAETTNGFEKLQQSAQNIQSGNVGETLFGLISAAINLFEIAISVVFAVPEFLVTLGVPPLLTGVFIAPLSVIVIYDVLHLYSGRFGSV